MDKCDECDEYEKFGTCPRANCKFPHDVKDVRKQEFFIARILRYYKENFVELQLNQNSLKKTFYIGQIPWNRNGAAEGDLVVFQTSPKQHEDVQSPMGRVFLVLSKNSPTLVPNINITVKESAFTLDPNETHNYDDALTIERCKVDGHFDCNKIGIHIVVAATPKNVSVNELSFYSDKSVFRKNENSLENGKYRLTVSVYLHTADNDSVTKPEFSVVRVTKNYKLHYDRQRYKDDMDILWSHFECAVNRKIAHTAACRYLSSTPKIWREVFILDQVMAKFNLGVRKLIEKTDAYYITASDPVYKKKDSDTILVPEEFFENARKCFEDPENYSNLKVLPLVATVGMSHWIDSPADSLSLKYERNVEICSESNKERIVKCTSPMRKIPDYVNQQNLIRCMINEESKLYAKTELLGILGIRFRTPEMLLAVVKTLDETSFTVNYNGCQSKSLEICKIEYATLCDEYEVSPKKRTICLKKILCKKKYFTRSIVCCDEEPYQNFIQEFCDEENFEKMQQHFREMEKTKEKQEPTYTNTNANDGTIINLQLRSELQFQISDDYAGDKSGLGLRLLQIGENCHLCILHMNHPELAFMSDRKDIRDQDLEKRIKIVTKMKTDEKLNTIQQKNRNIKWCDKYYSGGSFSTTTKILQILPGDFLCIRKEILSGQRREGVAKYVWNAHGIVVTFNEGNVEFSVCTLSQAEERESEEPKPDEEGFFVDIISTKQ